MKEKIKDSYGFIFEESFIKKITEVGQLKTVNKGDVLIELGTYIKFMPLIISGAIKILREDDEGDELLLYYLERGDTCAMSMNCCMGDAKSNIRAVAESDTELVLIPVKYMSEWISTYESWKSFVFESYHTRLQEMLEAIDSLAFLNMHERIYKYLTDKVKVTSDLILNATHQDIAHDLHTSRVVVSRILKKLEIDGKISLHRNKIEVIEY